MLRRYIRHLSKPAVVLDLLILAGIIATFVVMYHGLQQTRETSTIRRSELAARIAVLEQQMQTALSTVSDPEKLAVLYETAARLERFKVEQMKRGMPDPKVYFAENGSDAIVIYGELIPPSLKEHEDDRQ